MKTNSRGFTLIELMIYGGLGLGTLAAVFTIVVLGLQTFLGSQNRVESEEDFIRIESILRRTFQQAVRVRVYNNALTWTTQPEGWIRPFIGSLNDTELLALFHYEAQKMREIRGGVTIDSDTRGAGLFYLRPRLDGAVEREGAVILALDRLGAVAPLDQVRAQYRTNFWAGRLSNIAIPPLQITTRYTGVPGPAPAPYPTDRIASFSIDLTIRYFLPSTPMASRCYRAAAICAAAGKSTGRDVTKRITINLRNNEFGLNPLTLKPERLFGPLYFFHPYGRGLVNAVN